MSDEHSADTPAPAPPGAFDWLVESHQQALAMSAQVTPPEPVTPLPPLPAPPDAPAPSSPFSFDSGPLAPSRFEGGPSSSALVLERHGGGRRSGNGALDWIAFGLAFLAPPIGTVLAIVAVVTESRNQGYAASIAKAAIGIGAALTLALGVVSVAESKVAADRAAHQKIVASSAAWCRSLESDPQTLASDTFDWPAPGDTIPGSITAIKRYVAHWQSLEKVAPTGIRAGTLTVAQAAAATQARVQSTLTLNDTDNVAQMQNVVATSGIRAWASSFCG